MRKSFYAVSAAFLMSSVSPIMAQDYDAEFNLNWGLRMIGVDKALAIGIDGSGVLVGVTDTGLLTGLGMHSEFIGRLNGLSYDGYTGGPLDADINSHGTHVAGIIAANRDGFGMMGVASGATIVPLRVLGGAGPISGNDVLSGPIRYALDNGVRIFNASWGVPGRYDQFYNPEYDFWYAPFDRDTALAEHAEEIDLYREVVEAGAVMVFANGNVGSGEALGIQAAMPYYAPELEKGWLAVTSVGPDGQQAYYAQRCDVGMMWCLAAPGGDVSVDNIPGAGNGGIVSTAQPNLPQNPHAQYSADGLYVSYQGTSMAAPHVTASLALAAQLYPNASVQQLRTLVLQTATDIGAPGIDEIFGWGLLNVGNIVDAASPDAGIVYGYQTWSQAATVERLNDVVNDRFVVAATLSQPVFWLTPFGTVSWLNPSEGVEAKHFLRGLAGGVDYAFSADVTSGVFVAGSSSDVRNGIGDTATDSGFHGGAYLRYDNSAVFADLVLGASGFSGATSRLAPGLSGTVAELLGFAGFSGKTNSAAYWASGRLGGTVALDGLDVSPYAFGRALSQHFGEVAERGDTVLGASAAATSFATGEVGVGVQLRGTPMTVNKIEITPKFDLAYGRQVGDVDRSVTVLGNAVPTNLDIGRDALHIGGDLAFTQPGGSLSVTLSYDGTVRSGGHSHSVSANLSGKF